MHLSQSMGGYDSEAMIFRVKTKGRGLYSWSGNSRFLLFSASKFDFSKSKWLQLHWNNLYSSDADSYNCIITTYRLITLTLNHLSRLSLAISGQRTQHNPRPHHHHPRPHTHHPRPHPLIVVLIILIILINLVIIIVT